MKKLVRLICLLIVLMLVSCSAFEEKTNSLECLKIEGKIGYEVHYETNMTSNIDIVIPSEWKPQLEETLPIVENSIDQDIIATSEDIWINCRKVIYRYSRESKNLTIYELPKEIMSVENLSMTDSGDLWGIASSTEATPIIYFDKNINNFVGVEFHNSEGDSLTKKKGDTSAQDKLVIGSNNKLWYLNMGKLYLLDTSTNNFIIEPDLKQDSSIYQIANGPEENSLWIFILDEYSNILVYLYQNSQLEHISGFQESIFDLGAKYEQIPIESDQENRVWLSNRAWIELVTDPEELEINPSIVKVNKQLENQLFIGKGYNFSETYYAPSRINIFSDGSIWYSSLLGIIKMQPETGEYCKVISGISSDIAEAPDGSLWFVNNGQIYKHEPIIH